MSAEQYRFFAIRVFLIALGLAAVPHRAAAQSTYTWIASNGTTWTNSAGWSGTVPPRFPGVDGNAGTSTDGTAGDIAQFSIGHGSGTVLGIDMSPAAANALLSVGAISYGFDHTLTIGNSSTTQSGIVRLNGALVGGSPATLLNVSEGNLSIQNSVQGGNQSLTVQLGNTNGLISVRSGHMLTISTNIAEAASNSGFTVAGGGTVVLSGSNSFTGGVNVNSGTILQFSSPASLATSFTVVSGTVVAGYAVDQNFLDRIQVGSHGTIALGADSANTLNMSALGLMQLGAAANALFSGTLIPSGTTYQLGGGGGRLTVSTALGGDNNDLLAGSQGAGTVILTGNNTYGGASYISNGALQFNSVASIGGTGRSIIGGLNATVATGYAMSQAFLDRLQTSFSGTIALAADSGSPLNMSGFSSARLGAIGDATYSGLLTPDGTIYRLGGGGGTLTINTPLGGSNTVDVGQNGVTTGTVILNSTNSYTGSTTVSGPGCVLVAGAAVAVPHDATLSNSSTLLFGHDAGVGGTILISSDNSLGSYGSARSIANTLIFTSTTSSLLTLSSSPALDLTITGPVDLNSTATMGLTRSFFVNGNQTLAISGPLSQSGGTVGIAKLGAGTLVLTSANSYGGTTTLIEGTLFAAVAGAVPGNLSISTNSGVLLVGDNAAITDNISIASQAIIGSSGANRIISNSIAFSSAAISQLRLADHPALDLTIDGPVDLNTTTTANLLRALTASTGQTLTLGGIVDSNSSVMLTKAGSGTLVLSGNNTYSGSTAVNLGNLRIANTAGSATGTGPVTVNNSGKLSGSGFIGGSISALKGGTVAPGGSPGTLTVIGNASFSPGSTLAVAIAGSTDTDADRSRFFSVAGALTFSGTSADPFVVSVTKDAALANLTTAQFTIAEFGSIGSTGLDGSAITVTQLGSSNSATNANFIRLLISGFDGGDTMTLSRSGNRLLLNFTPVPEPGYTLAIIVGGLAWTWRKGASRQQLVSV